MRFIEISKPLVTQIISESLYSEGKEGKNTHLEHLEDNIFNKGFAGAKEAINYLYSLHQMLEGHSETPLNITTKWDGAPAIVCGKDPITKQFFVGTKGVFADKPKLNFTDKDIETNHPDKMEKGELKSAEGLRSKLKLALKGLRNLNWDTVVQGDLLWAGKGSFKSANIDGEQYLTFNPNTIVYAVPADSDLAKEMMQADVGIVFHTEYVGGPTLADTKAKFGYDSSNLGQASGVWYTDANIKDLSGTVTLTKQESDGILSAIKQADNYLRSIDQETFSWLDKGADIIGKDFLQQLKAHVNANIKNAGEFEQDPTKFAKGFIQKYVTFMQKEIDKVKTQATKDRKTEAMVQGVAFIREHIPGIVAVYDLYLKLIEAKIVFLRKLGALQTIPTFVMNDQGDYDVTGEEGFVAVDRMGNALKLVDRLDFSKNNFGTGKPSS